MCLKNAKQNSPMAAFWRTDASSSFSAHGGDFQELSHKEAKFIKKGSFGKPEIGKLPMITTTHEKDDRKMKGFQT